MNRHAESQLLDFCVRQHASFSSGAWQSVHFASRDELAATALFLAGLEWFGHREALLRVAEKLAPESSQDFAGLAKAVRFDCSRFSGLLKAHLKHALAHS